MNAEDGLDQRAEKSKTLLSRIFIVYVAIQALFFSIGPDISGIARILLTVTLMYFVLAGRKWAKWMLVILLYIGALFGLYTSFNMFEQSHSMTVIWLSVYAMAMGAIATFMIASKPLNRYFIFQGQKLLSKR